MTARDRRLLLAVRSAFQWGTAAIGEAPGISYADSSSTFRIETLAHTFGVAAGGWGNALPVEAAA